MKNLKLKRFWIPLAAASLFLVDGGALDRDTAEWARKNGLLGTDAAADYSDVVAFGVLPAGNLLTLSYADGKECVWCREIAAPGGTLLTVAALKALTGRRRPDYTSGNQEDSFPSGHTALSFSFATLSERNLEGTGADGIRYINYFLAGTVGWARVEAGRHYPSDVLVGAGLGMFVSAVINDTFRANDEKPSVYIGPASDNAMWIIASWRF